MARISRRSPVFVSLALAAVLTGAGGALLGTCGPFTDVAPDSFCSFVLEIFYLGITTGTTPTTFDPTANVTRVQMAAFLSRTVDGVLRRGNRRTALEQTWTPGDSSLAVTTLAGTLSFLKCDGLDVWVPNNLGAVFRVRASDGRLLESWTGASGGFAVLAAAGRIFVAGASPGRLYRIDPSQPAGTVTTVATNLGGQPRGILFDGQHIWTVNGGPPSSVSIVTPGASLPFTVTTVTAAAFGFFNGAVYDGSNVWVADNDTQAMFKLDATGAILQTVTIDGQPQFPVFDGANIWVPVQNANSVTVVRASNGAILATLTGNGVTSPSGAAFDGERILITNPGANVVSLWKAANFAPLGSFTTGSATAPSGATSDGINFWITLQSASKLARF